MTTIVVCSSSVRHPLSELTEGLNTYRVQVVRLKDRDAGSILQNLSAKGMEKVKKEDLVPLLLTPLMGGAMPEKERIRQAFQWLNQDYPGIAREDIQKMQAVVYALAVKFLKQEDLADIKEEIAMTLLGQMLVEDGIKKGREEGKLEGKLEGKREGKLEGRLEGQQEGILLTKTVLKLCAQGDSPEDIAGRLGIPVEMVGKILTD